MVNNNFPKAWKLVDSKTVFRHPYLTLAEDTVILPDGQRIEWLTMQDTVDFVSVICQNEDGKILIARQYCHPPKRVVHEFPGGRIGPGESPETAARRELMEEVNFYPHKLQKLGEFLANPRRSPSKCHLFLASDLEERSLPGDSIEFIGVEWLTIEEVETQILDGRLENTNVLASWTLFKLTQSARQK